MNGHFVVFFKSFGQFFVVFPIKITPFIDADDADADAAAADDDDDSTQHRKALLPINSLIVDPHTTYYTYPHRRREGTGLNERTDEWTDERTDERTDVVRFPLPLFGPRKKDSLCE